MQIILKIIVIATVFLCSVSVAAEDTAPTRVSFVDVNPVDAQEKVLKTQALALKLLEFEVFAQEKVRQFNENHIFSRSRMKITKQPDGMYRARYHQIDDASMNLDVSHSQSGAIPYVGILSYREQVFESITRTPEQLDPDSFAVVEIIPNRHIFSYQKGLWK